MSHCCTIFQFVKMVYMEKSVVITVQKIVTIPRVISSRNMAPVIHKGAKGDSRGITVPKVSVTYYCQRHA